MRKTTITERIGNLQRQTTALLMAIREVAGDTGYVMEGDLGEAAQHTQAAEKELKAAQKTLKKAQARLIPKEKVTDPWWRYYGIDDYMYAKCGGFLMYGGYDGIWCQECLAEEKSA